MRAILRILTPIVAQSSDDASLIITAICGELEFVVLVVEDELIPEFEPPPPQAKRLAVKPATNAVRTARLNR
jgi:hypothetical protein